MQYLYGDTDALPREFREPMELPDNLVAWISDYRLGRICGSYWEGWYCTLPSFHNEYPGMYRHIATDENYLVAYADWPRQLGKLNELLFGVRDVITALKEREAE